MHIEKNFDEGLSRLWQHTQDDSTFTIIGSQDKDTFENHEDELYKSCLKLISQDNKVAFKKLHGRYTYLNGLIGEEPSAIIYNITKEQALDLARALNQEAIVWKDKNFFGIIDMEDNILSKFTSNPKNITFTDVEEFGSRLAHHKSHNKGKLFAFTLSEEYLEEPTQINRFKKPLLKSCKLYDWRFR